MALLHEPIEANATRRPGQVFLVCGDEQHTYAAIDGQADRVAAHLLAAGLATGDRVGLLAENSAFYVAGFYGILKAGGIAVPLNAAADAATLERLTSRCGARFLIVGARHGRSAGRAFETSTGLAAVFVPDARTAGALPDTLRAIDLGADPPPATPPGPFDPDSPAAIIFTSGSTGVPQGATLTHRSLMANARSIVGYLRLDERDRVLCVLPFSYVYGLSLLTTHALVGGSLAIENRFAYPTTALATLAEAECTGLSGVPSTFAILLDRTGFHARDYPHLRYVTQAGGAMSEPLTRRLLDVLDDVELFVMYGATEASARLAYLPPASLPDRIGSIGRAIPGVELRILDAQGAPVGPYQRGEIVARGENLMQGYWGDPEATAAVLDEAGYHTGDLAYADDEGFIFIVGRARDFIKAGAHRVAAKEIEEVISGLDGVHEVAVIGAPDRVLGERIVAYVVLRPGAGALEEGALLDATKRRLPAYKWPSELHVRADLPHNAAGKIMKQPLRDAWQAPD